MTTPTDPVHQINLDGFREAACGDESERIELLQMYSDQLKQKLPQARAALERQQLQEAACILHPLVGATYTCGLTEFGAALRSLEQSAKTGDSAGVQALVPSVIAHAKSVETAIVAELNRRCP